jgi:hypothetical protein
VYHGERSNVNHLFPLKLAPGVVVLSSVSHQQGVALSSLLCPYVGNIRNRINFRGSTILKTGINYEMSKINHVQSLTKIHEKMHMHISTYTEVDEIIITCKYCS